MKIKPSVVYNPSVLVRILKENTTLKLSHIFRTTSNKNISVSIESNNTFVNRMIINDKVSDDDLVFLVGTDPKFLKVFCYNRSKRAQKLYDMMYVI